MSQRLKNTLSFVDLAPGASVSLVHGLVTSVGRPLAPDIVFVPSADLDVVTDAFDVTLTNNGLTPLSGALLVEAWHTIERSFSDVNDEDLPVKPYIVVSANGLANATPFVFVYNPFINTPGDNVYKDFSALEAAMNATEGLKILQFENIRHGTGNAISVPVGLPTQRITDPEGGFRADMVGRNIMIQGDTVVLANNGSFVITAFIDEFNVEYTNSTVGAAANPNFNGTWVVLGGGGTNTCVIPPKPDGGAWNMLDVEWFGYVAPYAAAGAGGVQVTVSDGARFANLRKIGGELNITNLTMLPNPAPVEINQPVIFEFGYGVTGDLPQLINTGTQAFWGCSLLAANQLFTLRVFGRIGGPNAAIEMGNSAGQINCHLTGFETIRTGAIRGTNPAAVFNVTQRHGLVAIGQQNTPTSPFAGNVNYGSQTGLVGVGGGTNIVRRLWQSYPVALNQQIPVLKTVAFTTNELGHNGAFQIVSPGAVNQPLPKIRDLQLANDLTATTPGALNSTGMEVNFKQRGAGSINLWGESPIGAQAAAVNTNGGAFVLAGTTITFTAVDALFTASMVGRAITIANADDAGNDGTFLITAFINANSVTWTNAAGATGALNGGEGGEWRVGDTIDGLAASAVVPAGGALTLLSDGVSNWRVIAGYTPPVIIV